MDSKELGRYISQGKLFTQRAREFFKDRIWLETLDPETLGTTAENLRRFKSIIEDNFERGYFSDFEIRAITESLELCCAFQYERGDPLELILSIEDDEFLVYNPYEYESNLENDGGHVFRAQPKTHFFVSYALFDAHGTSITEGTKLETTGSETVIEYLRKIEYNLTLPNEFRSIGADERFNSEPLALYAALVANKGHEVYGDTNFGRKLWQMAFMDLI